MKRLTLALVVTCSSVAFAQQPSTAAIPKDLVMLLMRGGMMMPGDTFDIVLGAPEGFPAELLPRGAKPLISTTTRTGMMVIAAAPDLPADMARFDRQLAAAGWTVGPRSGPAQQRGLLSSAPSQIPAMWCQGDRYASVSMSPRPDGGSFMRISVNDSSRGAPCAAMTQPSYVALFSDVDMPLLFPPPGSRAVGGSGAGGGMDAYDQRLRLQTTLSLPDVLRHYRAQLEKHGWTYQSQAIADGVGIVRFSLTSLKKAPVAATVSVTVVPGDPPLEISFRLVKAPPRPYLQ